MADAGFERLGAIDTEMLGLHSRMGELMAERGELMGRIGTTCTTGADVSLDWLGDQYDLGIAALGELGFNKKTLETEVPALEQVRDGITEADAAWLNSQRANVTMHRRLVIAPRVQDIGLVGTSRKPGLVARFDKKQQDGLQTVIWPELWNKFDDKAPIHDNGTTEDWSTGILLGDTVDPRDTSKPANDYNEAGLVFTSMTVAQQRDALKTEAAAHKAAGRNLSSADIAQLVVANAQLRVEGKPLLDAQTFTRLPHYPDTSVGGGLCVPDVGSDGRRLKLVGSDVGDDWYRYGVRRVLRVNP